MRFKSWIREFARKLGCQPSPRRPSRKSSALRRVAFVGIAHQLEDRTVPTGDTFLTATERFPDPFHTAEIFSTIETNIDVDMFKAFINVGDYIQVDIDAVFNNAGGTDLQPGTPGNQNSDLDAVLRVFNPNGSQLVLIDDAYDPGNNKTSHDPYFSFRATSGTGYYYFGVSSAHNYFYNPTVAGSGSNDRNGSASRGLFLIQINRQYNATPVANSVGPVNLNEDTSVGIQLSASDPNGDAVTYSFVGGPSNGTVSSFNASAGSFTYTPDADYFGSDSFSYRVQDFASLGGLFSNIVTVSINVAPVNDPPSFNKGGDVTVNEDAGSQSYPSWATAISAGPANEGQTVSFEVVNNNPGLFHTQPAVAANGTLTFRSADNLHGSATVSVRAWDSGGAVSSWQNFTLTVQSVNDVPSFARGSDQNVAEDSGARTVSGWATALSVGPANETGQTLAFETKNTNNALFSTQPWVDSVGTLRFTPAADVFGSATVEVRIRDNGGTDRGGQDTSGWQSFTITVTAVNDAPIARDDTATTNEDNSVTIDVRANDSAGPANESDQTLTIISAGPASFGTVTILADGKIRYTPNANYNGSDKFSYTIEDSGSPPLTASASGYVTINAINDRPIALNGTATVAEDANPGVTINLRDLVSDVETADADLTYSIVTYPTAVEGTLLTTADKGIYTFRPAADFNGIVRFTYQVQDTGDPVGTPANALWSEVREVVVTVTAVNDDPVADNDGPYAVDEGGTLTVATPGVLLGDYDVDNPLITAKLLTLPAHGALTLNADGSFLYIHNGSETTSDSFTYRAFDGDAYSNIATVTLTINPVNDAPVGKDDSYTVAEDKTLTVTAAGLLANDTDVDSATLTVATPRPVTGPSHGTLTVNADGSFTYQPVANYHGSDSFTYQATDGAAVSNLVTVSITITPVNDDPIAIPGTATIHEDGGIGVDLWALVTDVETPDDQLMFTVGGAVNGVVSLMPDGRTAWFTPNTNYNGPASFTYTVTDTGDGASPAITVGPVGVAVTVTAVNDEPTTIDGSASLAEDGSVVIDLTALASDVETSVGNLTYNILSVSNGTLTPVSGQNGKFTYQPTADFNGTVFVSFSVTDTGEGASPALTSDPASMVTITVTPVNDTPVVSGASLTTAEDNTVDIDLWTLVSDVESADDKLSFSVANAVNGSVALLADGHTARFTPTANYNGAASFTYAVTDTGDGASAAITVSGTLVSVTVTPINDTPVVSGASLTTAEDNAVDIDLWILVSDVETADAALTFSVSNAVNGTVTLLVDGHTARFTPTTNYNGAASFTYAVTDTGDGTSAAITVSGTVISVTVTPVNDTPVVNGASLTTAEDNAVDIDLWTLVSDVETADTALTFSVSNAVNGSVVLLGDGHTARFTPSPNYNGAASFAYSVTDTADGTSAAITVSGTVVTVTVTEVNDTPTATADDVTLAEDSTVAVNVRGNDLTGPANEAAQTLSVTAVTQPAHGTVSINADGTVQYTPHANYYGADSFTYTITDNGTTNGSADAKSATATVTVTVTNVNDAPVALPDTATVTEDTTGNLIDVLGNDSDVDNLTGPVNAGLTVTAVTDPAYGSATLVGGQVRYTPDPDYYGADSFVYTVSDPDGVTRTATVSVTVINVNDAPVVGAITGPLDPTQVATSIVFAASFVDADPTDAHTITWNWGDGKSNTFTPAVGVRSTTTNHTYSAAGVYTVTLNVNDGQGGSDESVFQYVVIYDPSAGYVTGAGHFNSPAGAYVADPLSTGKAHFWLSSKYEQGASVPDGYAKFHYKVANFQFDSTVNEWLVISGPKARYRGTGAVNNVSGYGFELTAWDGQRSGGGGVDRFRIKVWDTNKGNAVVYDNQLGAPDGADPTTALSGGTVVIQTKGSPLMAEAGASSGGFVSFQLDDAVIRPLADEAIRRWAVAGAEGHDLETLRRAMIHVTDLPPGYLGLARPDEGTISIDIDGTGHGWFVDGTPWDDSEFAILGNQGEYERMDLLSVLMHEYGHLLGHEHELEGVMGESLALGERSAPDMDHTATPDHPRVTIAGLWRALEAPPTLANATRLSRPATSGAPASRIESSETRESPIGRVRTQQTPLGENGDWPIGSGLWWGIPLELPQEQRDTEDVLRIW